MKLKHTLKAGKHIIIDPCYIFPDNEWSELCECFVYELEKSAANGKIKAKYPYMGRVPVVASYENNEFVIIPTAFGDGCYAVTEREKEIGECGVDAGLLSVIPLELAATWPEFEKNKHLGVIVELGRDMPIVANGDGNFTFGRISVKTD